MDSMRSLKTSLPGASPAKAGKGSDASEQLLDAFKAAALSVTKLYKASAAAELKSRAEGYQDCLEDLLAFLDKENIGLKDGSEGWRIRQWLRERSEGRETLSNIAAESEDEVENAETASLPEAPPANSTCTLPTPPEAVVRIDSDLSTASVDTVTEERQQKSTFPTQETFTFQVPSNSGVGEVTFRQPETTGSIGASATTTATVSRPPRRVQHNSGSRVASRTPRRTVQKRKLDYAEIFGLHNLGYPKDDYRDSKRGRFV